MSVINRSYGGGNRDIRKNENADWFDDFFDHSVKTAEDKPSNPKKEVKKQSQKDLSAIANAIAERASMPIKDKMVELRERVGLDLVKQALVDPFAPASDPGDIEGLEGQTSQFSCDEKEEVIEAFSKNRWLKDYIDKLTDESGPYLNEFSVMDGLGDLGIDKNDSQVIDYIKKKLSAHQEAEKSVEPPKPRRIDEREFDDAMRMGWGEDTNTNLK